jgi:hypothetical protein
MISAIAGPTSPSSRTRPAPAQTSAAHSVAAVKYVAPELPDE